MFDSRKYCPQCGSDQVKYQSPQNAQGQSVGVIGIALITCLVALAIIFEVNLIDLLAVWLILIIASVFILALMNRRKVYRMKCQQCGHQWTMTEEEWLQDGNAPVQKKTLSPQERQEKRSVVESLIDQIKKM